MKILLIFGTRPEAIKMAPVIKELQKSPHQVITCVSGQHEEMLGQVLQFFDITPDINLRVMRGGQSLSQLTARIITEVEEVIRIQQPDWIGVHGDTTTSFCAALSAYYQKVPVFHVEAGLRTNDIYAPWPEEINRRLVARLSQCHYAPTEAAQQNLLAEGVKQDSIVVTGNTVIDALLYTAGKITDNETLRLKCERDLGLSADRREQRLLLVTGHRRENFGEGLESICRALINLAKRYQDLLIYYPVHLNPNVKEPVTRLLGNIANIKLSEPLEYLAFVYAMMKSTVILTDSGGVQEEAPALGKPVLVMREMNGT